MAKPSTHFVCQSCGATSAKWAGRCETCGEWNSFVEEALPSGPPKSLGAKAKGGGAARLDFVDLQGQAKPVPRRVCGIAEFDRVTGGGLVPGSVLLVGGDPGIGKSTLLLQVAGRLAGQMPVAYISGEESVEQVRLRGQRLGLATAPVQLASATSVRDIIATLD